MLGYEPMRNGTAWLSLLVATVVTDTLALTVLAGVAGAATGAQGGLDLADLARHAAQDEHATAVVVAEPTGALRDARVTATFRDLGARCPVPLFVVAAPRPFRCVRCVGPSSADGLVVEHLRRAGLEVAGAVQRPAALGRLLQRPQPPRAPDGTLVIMGPHDLWQVPEDTLLVAVATTAS